MGAAIVAHGDPPPVLDAVEHDLDFMALLVEGLVVAAFSFAMPAGRDAGGDAPVPQCGTEPVGVVTPVSEEFLSIRHHHEQAPCALVIAGLAGSEDEGNGLAHAIADGVQLGVQAALRAPETAGNSPGGSSLAAVR